MGSACYDHGIALILIEKPPTEVIKLVIHLGYPGYDLPAEHWVHLRTTNPIESVFATVRHRTVRTKGCLSHATAVAMVFKLIVAAARSWRVLKGSNQLPKLIQGVKFRDGIEVIEINHNAAA